MLNKQEEYSVILVLPHTSISIIPSKNLEFSKASDSSNLNEKPQLRKYFR